MFTGIVEETGVISSIKRGQASSVLTIFGKTVFDDLHLGDSVAVDGVCLTVTAISGKSFNADVMHETLKRSTLGSLRQNDKVNLERAMPANGRFGGHIVSGHIDGCGTISRIQKDDNAIWYTIRADKELLRYIVLKGSIAINGISLTVAALTDTDFSVSIIPFTAAQTTLAFKKVGDMVNLENDIIGKYVERLLSFGGTNATDSQTSGANNLSAHNLSAHNLSNNTITAEFLIRNGF